MASVDVDQNLLFGVLALQMDFISREALIAATSAWVLDKRRPLAQILVDQGALSCERRAMLEPLVKGHLEAHGDASMSLGAVSSIGSVYDDLAQIADPELRASLGCIPRARLRDQDPFATQAPSVGTPSSAGARFRILRPHARGGLGEIYVARDEELNREVALKVIQDRHADHQDSRSRFVLEAKITGSMEHPGIVPMYGLGHYSDGRPFYAMRFIRGDSLKDAIKRYHRAGSERSNLAERTLEFRKLLGRFVDVCNAMAYAHSRGVLHRDLKPDNVMLGQYGETIVVDWGIAKTIGRAHGVESHEPPVSLSPETGTPETMVGSAMGTPQYMSPEQAVGRLDLLGPSSDVYSLGATLYHLLTGKAPFDAASVGEILQRVQKGDFEPPRQCNDDVPSALEAICLKAMALNPEQRYTSPGALAGDIERWLADSPVSVYRDPPLARIGRWARRNSHLVIAAAIFTSTAIISLSIDDLGLSGVNIVEVILTALSVILALLLLLVYLELSRTKRRLAEERAEAKGAGQ
jgi:serine/threonine-protein kinase